MFILNEFEGSRISLDSRNANLYQVLQRIADAARKDGFSLVIDPRIKGKIKIDLDEPWNQILVEILAGVEFAAIIESRTIIIYLPC